MEHCEAWAMAIKQRNHKKAEAEHDNSMIPSNPNHGSSRRDDFNAKPLTENTQPNDATNMPKQTGT